MANTCSAIGAWVRVWAVATALAALSVLARADVIAAINTGKVESQSKVFTQLAERRDNILNELKQQLEARRQFEYLPAADAEKGAVLFAKQLSGRPLTEQENRLLQGYLDTEKSLRQESSQLLQTTNPTEEQRQRLQALDAAHKENLNAIKQTATDLEKRFQDEQTKLNDTLFERDQKAIETACKEAGASICLADAIDVWQPLDPQSGALAPAPVTLVHWGHRDITDRVIALLDASPLADATTGDGSGVAVACAAELRNAFGRRGLTENGSDTVRVPGSIAASLPLMVAAMATAVQGQGVALLNMYQVDRDAAPYQQARQALDQLDADQRDEYNIQAGFRYLNDKDANRAAALQMKQIKGTPPPTPEELAEVEALVKLNSDNEIEFGRLVVAQDLTEDQKRRLKELGDLKRAREDTLKQLDQSLMSAWAAQKKQQYDAIRGQLQQAIEQACKAVGATVCLQSVILIWEPSEDGQQLQGVPVQLVHWGGTDVTNDVISILSKGAAGGGG